MHQAIIAKYGDDKNAEITPIVKDYEGVSLLGPHSLVIAYTMSNSKKFFSILDYIYFTDAGPFGETSLENPKVNQCIILYAKGSLFLIDLGEMIIRPLALNCLAYPTGLALSNNEKNM